MSHPVRGQDDQEAYFNGLIIDVTTQQQNELALQQMNQLLEQRVAERTFEVEHRRKVAESLRSVLVVINSGQDLSHILDHIVSIANDLMEADASAVVRFDFDKNYASTEASQGFPSDLPISGYELFQHGSHRTDFSIVKREPLMVEQFDRKQLKADLQEADIDPKLKAWRLRALDVYSAYLALPLVIQDKVFGSLLFYYKETQVFTPERVQVAMSLAKQVALAIENAYLHQQIQEAAAADERNRLARDLHDAVSQTLFSASLIAEVLPSVWEQNKLEGWRRLEELRQLTRGAQAEMRTLLHELRPEGLVESNLAALLRQLTEAMQGRIRIPVTLSGDPSCNCPVDVKLAFYRIAQEALNNMARHAYATRASVTLRYQGNGLVLTVSDDGRGFTPADVQGEHYGLKIMAERAAEIGAMLEIDSAPREGTMIRASWQPASEEGHEYIDSCADCG
ncbi:MAG: histidine kinase [Anaerolineae bacterium]